MSSLESLSRAHVVLVAIRLIAESDLAGLTAVSSERRDVLTPELIYRLVLTFYVEDGSSTSTLTEFLHHVEAGFTDVSPLDTAIDLSTVRDLSDQEAYIQSQHLRLRRLHGLNGKNPSDLLAAFVITWVHQVESTSGPLPPLLQLVDAFIVGNQSLKLWRDTYLLPVLKIRYDFYPEAAESVGVRELEKMEGVAGVQTLLQFAEGQHEKAQMGRDIRSLVTPWIQGSRGRKRRRLNDLNALLEDSSAASWDDLNEWILTTSVGNFDLAAKAIHEWGGPSEEREELNNTSNSLRSKSQLRYGQTALAALYATKSISGDRTATSRRLLARVADLAGLRDPSQPGGLPNIQMAASEQLQASRADLLLNALLRPENQLTCPSAQSINFANGVLTTLQLLEGFQIKSSASQVAEICLTASEEKQAQEFRRILQQIPRITGPKSDWLVTRDQLLWLHSWHKQNTSDTSSALPNFAYLAKIDLGSLEADICDAIIADGQYDLVAKNYIKSSSPPLSSAKVEELVVSAILAAYDNASNGNRNRGAMKRAFEMLTVFQPLFPSSPSLQNIDHLIKATHSMSFYQLTLHHGVPFQPVNIRVHQDPISLIGKILDQNPRAYAKLDDLLGIGRHLVQAGLQTDPDDVADSLSVDARLFHAGHRVTFLAITSALAAHDFETAYSYIITRLSTTRSRESSSQLVDDTSWRAAYVAGKYRPQTSPGSLHGRIAALSQRMDLLSLALTLAPDQDSLPDILATWQRCEEEMDGLKTQAIQEERAFEAHSDGTLPGGFDVDDRDVDAAETRRVMAKRSLAGAAASYEEQAPMGLFDVARGAASAIRKSAFPLGAGRGLKIHDSVGGGAQTEGRTSQDSLRGEGLGDGRVRKRDMVSNMVTGGLMSGMSWVLGAQPAAQSEAFDDES